MMRKYQVRFGGGLLEKGLKGHLASSLPDFRAASTGVDTLLAYFLTQPEADMILIGCIPTPR
jgi:hypothetical protein